MQHNPPAEDWQVCVAPQVRECPCALEAGDAVLAPRMKRVFRRAWAIPQRRDTRAASPLDQDRGDLPRRVHRWLALQPTHPHGRRLQQREATIQDPVGLLLADGSLPPTNHASEPAIRLSTIFRKVPNGWRSAWGRDLVAAVRSVGKTGTRQGVSAVQSIRSALSPGGSLFNPG